MEDFKSMHIDLQSKLVDDFLGPILAELRDLEGMSEEETKALGLLMSWEGALTKESPAALVFENLLVAAWIGCAQPLPISIDPPCSATMS